MSDTNQPHRVGQQPDLVALKKKLLLRFGADLFVGESELFLQSIDRMTAYSSLQTPVLIIGETGTGKESIARAIHYLGNRADMPFIPVNCGAIPDNLLENELFGHERGAYTDASRAHRGLVQEAIGGTLFLDEINTLTPAGQVKLLRFLEDRRYKPLGASKYVEADVRFIAATNVRLRDEVDAGRFREDLFYRIYLLTVELPPLRDRGGDVLAIAQHYVRHYARVYNKSDIAMSPEAATALSAYRWPGNVRELKNAVEKAVIDARTDTIGAQDLGLFVPVRDNGRVPHSLREAKSEFVRNFEREYLLKALVDNDWNVSKAARSARKDRRSFQRLLRLHGITFTPSP